MKQDLERVIPALVTPLTAENSFDEKGMRRHVRYVVDSGMTTLFVLGFAGEVSAFSREQRRQILLTARQEAGPQVRIIAGVFDNATELILEHCRDADQCGADYVLTTPTNFYPLRDEELEALFVEIADQSPLPLIIYNCPLNRHRISAEIICRLAAHPNIVGLKQTSDLLTVEKMQQAEQCDENFTVLSGEEFDYLGSMTMGLKGYVMGGPGNIFPRKCLRIQKNFMEEKRQEAIEEYRNMISFLFELYALPVTEVGGIKAVMELSGVCSRWMRKPLISASDELMEKIRALMEKYEITLD